MIDPPPAVPRRGELLCFRLLDSAHHALRLLWVTPSPPGPLSRQTGEGSTTFFRTLSCLTGEGTEGRVRALPRLLRQNRVGFGGGFVEGVRGGFFAEPGGFDLGLQGRLDLLRARDDRLAAGG